MQSGVYSVNQKARRQRNQIRFMEYLADKACVDCGIDDPIVLELDHQRDKEFAIGAMVSRGGSWERIEKEIAKCLVRCANCHRRKTAKDFGWYKAKRTHKSSTQSQSEF